MNSLHPFIKASIDGGFAGVILAVLVGFLPTAGAILAVIWYGLQIWESATVQGWLKRRASAAQSPPPSPSQTP